MIDIKVMDVIEETAFIKEILVKHRQKVKTYQSIVIIDNNGKEVEVRSLFDGYINSLYVKVGDRVTYRSPIARLDINFLETKFMTDEFKEADLFFDFEEEIAKTQPQKLSSKSKNKSKKSAPLINQLNNQDQNPISNKEPTSKQSGIKKFKEEILARIATNENEVKNQNNETLKNSLQQPKSFREMIMKNKQEFAKKLNKDDIEVQRVTSNLQNKQSLLECDDNGILEQSKTPQKIIKKYDTLEQLVNAIEPQSLLEVQDENEFITVKTTIDVKEIMKLRKKVLDIHQSFASFSYIAFVMKAISLSLEDFINFNACYMPLTNELFVKRYHNIGIALQTEIGIKILVIRLIEKLNLNQIVNDIENSMHRLKTNQTHHHDFTNRTIIMTLLPVDEILKQTKLFFAENVCVIAISKITVQEQHHSMIMTIIFNRKIFKEIDAKQFLDQIKSHLEKPYILSLNLL